MFWTVRLQEQQNKVSCYALQEQTLQSTVTQLHVFGMPMLAQRNAVYCPRLDTCHYFTQRPHGVQVLLQDVDLVLLLPQAGYIGGIKAQVIKRQVCTFLHADCKPLFLQCSIGLRLATCDLLGYNATGTR